MSFNVYVAGPVLRPAFAEGRHFPVAKLYERLSSSANEFGARITLPAYSETLDALPAGAFGEEIRKRIGRADAMIAVILPPGNAQDLSGYSIAVEAHEAAQAGKPIAFLAEHPERVPRLLASLDRRNKRYAFAELETFDRVFKDLAQEIERRR